MMHAYIILINSYINIRHVPRHTTHTHAMDERDTTAAAATRRTTPAHHRAHVSLVWSLPYESTVHIIWKHSVWNIFMKRDKSNTYTTHTSGVRNLTMHLHTSRVTRQRRRCWMLVWRRCVNDVALMMMMMLRSLRMVYMYMRRCTTILRATHQMPGDLLLLFDFGVYMRAHTRKLGANPRAKYISHVIVVAFVVVLSKPTKRGRRIMALNNFTRPTASKATLNPCARIIFGNENRTR